MFERTFIIAEAGVNHNGDLKKAIEMVYAAKESGADAIKFQYFTLKGLFAPKYYTETLGLKNDEWMSKIEEISFKDDWHSHIYEESKKAGITYFSTPFSHYALKILDPFVPFYKIASCDITNLPLIENIGKTGKGVFVSTGASNLLEIDRAISTLKTFDLPFICIMHCIMLYPAPLKMLNLGFISTLLERYNLPVGFSDHSQGIEAAPIAISLGARAIEKHFTLDKNYPGGDHKNSLNPVEFKRLVKNIRKLEKIIDGKDRVISDREKNERVYARRGIYAKKDIKKGEKITLQSLTFLRPNIGIGVENINNVIDKKAKVNIKAESLIEIGMIE